MILILTMKTQRFLMIYLLVVFKFSICGLTIIWVNCKPTSLSHTMIHHRDNECIILLVLWWHDIFQCLGEVSEFSTVLIIQN